MMDKPSHPCAVRAPPATRPAVYAPAAALEPPRGWEASRVASSAQLGGLSYTGPSDWSDYFTRYLNL